MLCYERIISKKSVLYLQEASCEAGIIVVSVVKTVRSVDRVLGTP